MQSPKNRSYIGSLFKVNRKSLPFWSSQMHTDRSKCFEYVVIWNKWQWKNKNFTQKNQQWNRFGGLISASSFTHDFFRWLGDSPYMISSLMIGLNNQVTVIASVFHWRLDSRETCQLEWLTGWQKMTEMTGVSKLSFDVKMQINVSLFGALARNIRVQT